MVNAEPEIANKSRVIRCVGHANFRHRLVLSLLSRRPVRFDEIRSEEDEPGIKDFEVSFLRLMERISNGSVVEISYTGQQAADFDFLQEIYRLCIAGTSVLFSPGTLLGGTLKHDCPLSRAVGWFLEPILALAPFCKRELILTLSGITTDSQDASVR